jgi:hypothetical protein
MIPAIPEQKIPENGPEPEFRPEFFRNFEPRRGGTNPVTARTVPPYDVIGKVINSNQAFIPIAIVRPFGGFGSLFCHFIDDVNTLPSPTFPV